MLDYIKTNTGTNVSETTIKELINKKRSNTNRKKASQDRTRARLQPPDQNCDTIDPSEHSAVPQEDKSPLQPTAVSEDLSHFLLINMQPNEVVEPLSNEMNH